MRTLSKKVVSIFLSVVLVLGMFATILPTISLAALAQNAVTEYDYEIVLNGVSNDTGINDTRVWNVWDSTLNDGAGGVNDFGTNGLKSMGIWNAMGLDAAWGAIGISHHFFSGTAVGAEKDEIHPYIVYNVTPGSSFELSSAVHKDSDADAMTLNFYVSNDGVTWVPIDAEKNYGGIWESRVETYDSYNSYVYTIANIGLKSNFVKVEYPFTMATENASEISDDLLVYGAAFVPVADYAVNGETLFESTSFPLNKEFYEEHFIAYPDFVNMYDVACADTSAATSNYGMLASATWGHFEEKDRSYVAMVAPGSHFYLETANNHYMKTLGEALVKRGELDSADQARIRVYTSATLSDETAWQEWDPMPYSCQDTHTPTFNFYLPEDHIYVRIVYPQKGSVDSVLGNGTVGNDAAFFTDMVFTPYVAADADYTYDYTSSAYWDNPQAGTSNLSQDTNTAYGVTIPYTGEVNLVNDNALNTGDPYERGHNSIVYEVEGGKMFNLEYAVRFGNFGGTAGDGNTKGNYEANVTDGSSMELIIESSADGSTWSSPYETESGYAQTSKAIDNGCYAFDVSYLVPKDAKYIRVSFGITGVGYLATTESNIYQGFNDCLYLRKVSVANANNLHETVDKTEKVFVYETDTDATKATETGNIETAAIDNATGYRGGYAYLVANDGANVQTLAGTLQRPYVVYDVMPGSTFSFDYSMRATAKAASEATAHLNLRAGLGDRSLKEFEFFVYGREKANGEWKYIGKTKSDAKLDYNGGDIASYDTLGYASESFTVPSNITQIKVELPNTGAFTTATPATYDYTTVAAGDYGGWNGVNLGAFDNTNGINNSQYLVATSGKGLSNNWTHSQVAWGEANFYLIYKVQPGSTFLATFDMPSAATRANYKALTGDDFEFVVESSSSYSEGWSNAKTTAGQGTSAVIGYHVPVGCEYVKVTFPQKGIIPELDYVANDNTYMTGVSFYAPGAWVTAGNDAAHLYNVTYATGIFKDVEYVYSTDTDTTGANSAVNTETAEIDGATGFRGGYGHLVAGDGANVKTLAGTLERPYVIYDVMPGSNFSFDYSMYATAKAASEATAAMNIKAGFGSEALREFEFFVYGRKDENSAWSLIGKTDSSALDYRGGDSASYGTNGYGAGNFTVPANVTQVKVELPNTGAITTATPATYDYTTVAAGDYAGWNGTSLGAFDNTNGINNSQYLVATSGKGLSNHWTHSQVAWGEANFYLIYKVQPNSTFVATFTMPDSGTRANYKTLTGDDFEFVVESSSSYSEGWSNAVTTAGQETNCVIGYRVPAGCEYVKVTFPQKGIIPELNYVANDNTFMTGVSFYNPGAWITAGNDAAHLYNITYATGIVEEEEDVEYEYEYSTDTDTTGANSSVNTETGEINGATGFKGGYGHLVAGDGANVKTLAGTLERPYVIYDVFPGSNFSFEYAMRATAKAASEATAAMNIMAGFGNESLRAYEYVVYGRKDESSEWTYIGTTDSSALDYNGGDTSSYDTFGTGAGNFVVPAGVNQIKVELPGTGAFTTATATTYDYINVTGDYGGWNYNNLGAYDTYYGGNANCKLVGNSGSGLGVHWSDAQGDWGTKDFYLIYAVQPNSTFVANFTMPASATRNGYAAETGEPFEFVVSSCATADGTYDNAVTTAGQETDCVIGYRVPAGCNYVKVTFPTKGIIPEYNYVANDNTFMTGVSFYAPGAWITAGNDASYLYNVNYAISAEEVTNQEYEYTYGYSTDNSASGANSAVNTETAEIDGATGFRGGYGHLVAGDGANVKTLAGTLSRPYVIYDVYPGSNFSFEYAMRATAKAASEATAAMNIKAGFGSEALKAYEYVVYGRADESSEWTYIGTTDSSALSFADGADTSSYDTFGTGAGNFVVPAGVNQIKVELPSTGAFTTATATTYDYINVTGDYGGWNYNNLGAYDTYYGGNANCKLVGNSGSGLGVHWSDAQGDWGTKDFYLIYAVQPNSTFVANFTMPASATRNGYAAETGEPFEFVVSSCATADGTYDNAVTTAGQETDCVIGYRVPAGCNYVKVTFPTKGIIPEYNYVANDNTFMTGVSFYAPGAWITAGNDASYLYNITYATSSEKVAVDKEDNYEYEYTYNYSTDSTASGTSSTNNTETGEINGATGFKGGYGHLVAGDGANVKTLAGTLERPYVIYDVYPGSNFSFEYAMRATAKAASEATAAMNIMAGFGNESLRAYEYVVYGRADENSNWAYICTTDSSALTFADGANTSSYDTFGTGAGSFTVPDGVNQIKIELPGTGAFTTATAQTYDYTTITAGDYGGWNYTSLGGYDNYYGGNADCKILATSGSGLGVNYGDAQGDWGTKDFYLIYAVQPNSTFVANFKMQDAATRNGYAEKTGEPFEFVVSSCATADGAYGNEVTTAGQGTDGVIGYQVPAGCNYVKVTFPTKGIIPEYNYVANDTFFMTGVSFYAPGAWITAGNDASYLYNVNYATSVTATPIIPSDVDYTNEETTNISSSNKKNFNIYNFGDVSMVNGEGIVAISDEAFVTYKIKEDTMITLKTGCDLTFEYSVDDSDYKPFEAVKTCYGYVIPAIAGRNYIKVVLKNGQSISKVDAEVMAPTAKFYIPYLDKYELVDYADYGAAANSVAPSTLTTLRHGYNFLGWGNETTESVYLDRTFTAIYEKSGETAYTVTYTVNTTDGEDTDAMTTTTTYQFDDLAVITAPETNDAGQVFSKWVDERGADFSDKATCYFLVGGDVTVRAVYADTDEVIGAKIYANNDPIIKANDNGTWNMSVVWRTEVPDGITVAETGILLGKEVDKPNLVLWDTKTQSGTYKFKHSNTDTNRTAMYTIKNIPAAAVRTALPYAVLSNGDIIYGEYVMRVEAGEVVKSAFEFNKNDALTNATLSNYLDRASTYDVMGTADGQDMSSAIYNAKDFLRQTNAKYLARGITGEWGANISNKYYDNFDYYKSQIDEIHEIDPEVIIEAAIFETCSEGMNDIPIPAWVFEAFGQPVETRNFNYEDMMHTWKKGILGFGGIYGKDEWGTGIHTPSISQLEFQMFLYYRACTFIDMGAEALHLGQMYRIGATSTDASGDVNAIDHEAWAKVLDMITEYAKTHARRGYVLFNGHNENGIDPVRADGSNEMLVHFNMYPLRIEASGSDHSPSESFQAVTLQSSGTAPYNDVMTGYVSPLGDTFADCYPYLLEFDNFGVDAENIDKVSNDAQDTVWGYDEISWYANQTPANRHSFLTTTVVEWLNTTLPTTKGAANGHIAMPGKRTASISSTGGSEYYTDATLKAAFYDNYIKTDGNVEYSNIPLWDICNAQGDMAAIHDAWEAAGYFDGTAK